MSPISERARSTPAVIPHPHRQILDEIPHTTPFFWLAAMAGAMAVVQFALRRPLHVWPLWSWVALAALFLLIHKPLHYNHLVEFPFTLAVAAGATLGAALRATAQPPGAGGPRWASPDSLSAALAAFRTAMAPTSLHAEHRSANKNVAAAQALGHVTRPGALVVDDRPSISVLAHRRVVGPHCRATHFFAGRQVRSRTPR